MEPSSLIALSETCGPGGLKQDLANPPHMASIPRAHSHLYLRESGWRFNNMESAEQLFLLEQALIDNMG